MLKRVHLGQWLMLFALVCSASEVFLSVKGAIS